MGIYINVDSKGVPLGSTTKMERLEADGAVRIPEPREWSPDLVCVIDNIAFQAAGWAHYPLEMKAFIDDLRRTGRIHQWYKYPHVRATVDGGVKVYDRHMEYAKEDGHLP